MCHVTERATSVRTAGARGERSQRIVVGKWKRSGREESVAREREGSRGSYDRSREIERSGIRGTAEGGPRGEPRNDRYEDGYNARTPCIYMVASVPVRDGGYLLLLALDSRALLIRVSD